MTDETVKAGFLRAFAERTEVTPPTPFTLFRVDVTEVSFLRPEGDHLVIEWWGRAAASSGWSGRERPPATGCKEAAIGA